MLPRLIINRSDNPSIIILTEDDGRVISVFDYRYNISYTNLYQGKFIDAVINSIPELKNLKKIKNDLSRNKYEYLQHRRKKNKI